MDGHATGLSSPRHHTDRTYIRTVRRIAPGSARAVLIEVAEQVRRPDWSLAAAGHALATHVDGELEPLRVARIHLLTATMERTTLSQARALATLNVAIAEAERRRTVGTTASPSTMSSTRKESAGDRS